MAVEATSTPAPGIPPEWRDLWESASRTHPDAPEALHNAIAAGVDPRDLRLIQLTDQDDDPAPLFWFGARSGVCVIINPRGVVGSAILGRVA